jgi:hypothetical protein
MGKAERYLDHAEECLAFAKSVADPIWRAQLVAMAAQWRAFAARETEVSERARQPTRNRGCVERMNSHQSAGRS